MATFLLIRNYLKFQERQWEVGRSVGEWKRLVEKQRESCGPLRALAVVGEEGQPVGVPTHLGPEPA